MGVHEKVDAFVRENATLHQRLEAVEAASKGGVEHLNQTGMVQHALRRRLGHSAVLYQLMGICMFHTQYTESRS